LLFPLALSAQKSVDLDKYRFSVQYRSLPKIRIDSTYRTYNVEVEGTKLMEPLLQDMSPEKSVMLEGWRKLAEDGHLSIKINLGDLLPEVVSVKERVVTTKNRDGVITGTKTYYYQEVVYTFSANASITYYKGMHIMDEELASRGHKQVYRSPEFTIRALAEGYFVVNSLTVTKQLLQNCVNRAMHHLSERISDNFGFREVTANDYMWIIDSRKHPEYAACRQAFRVMNEVLFSMNPSTSIEGAREQLKPAIDYFEKIKKNYTSYLKDVKKSLSKFGSFEAAYNAHRFNLEIKGCVQIKHYVLDSYNSRGSKDGYRLIFLCIPDRDKKGSIKKTNYWQYLPARLISKARRPTY